jgi:hypothetical protein
MSKLNWKSNVAILRSRLVIITRSYFFVMVGSNPNESLWNILNFFVVHKTWITKFRHEPCNAKNDKSTKFDQWGVFLMSCATAYER